MTAPVTWASGDAMTATKLNTEIRDQFLRQFRPPRAHVYKSTSATFTSTTTPSLLTFQTTLFDSSYNGSTLFSSGNRLVAPIAGLYLVTAQMSWAESNSASGIRMLNVRRNSNNVSSGGTSYTFQNAPFAGPYGTTPVQSCSVIPMAASDHVQVFVAQNSGITLSAAIAGPNLTFLEAIWLSNLPAGTP